MVKGKEKTEGEEVSKEGYGGEGRGTNKGRAYTSEAEKLSF